MSLNHSKLLRTANTSPHSKNPIYQVKITFGCFVCFKEDKRQKKKFRDLYALFRHCNHNHSEQEYYDKIILLAELIIEGSLR